jgi:hypothetical protein
MRRNHRCAILAGRTCVTIRKTLIAESLTHPGLYSRFRRIKLEPLSRKAKIRSISIRLKEISMDTSKVIELGTVSEETKGVIYEVLESLQEPNFGPVHG